jgi:hypothetical protein
VPPENSYWAHDLDAPNPETCHNACTDNSLVG